MRTVQKVIEVDSQQLAITISDVDVKKFGIEVGDSVKLSINRALDDAGNEYLMASIELLK